MKTTKKFVTCPHCSSKSKVVRTEFGGLQTRICAVGHTFTYDKWMADRTFGTTIRSNPF